MSSSLSFMSLLYSKHNPPCPKQGWSGERSACQGPPPTLPTSLFHNQLQENSQGILFRHIKIQTENNFKIKTLNLLCCILAGCSWTAVFAQLIDFFGHLLSLHQKLNSRQGASYSSCILNIHQFHIYNMGKKISACLWSLISPKQSRIILIFFEIAYFFIHAQN